MGGRIFNLHDVFLIITIFEVLLLAIYRSALPGTSRTASYLLIAFLLVVALDTLTSLIMWNDDFPVSEAFRQHALPLMFCLSHFIRGPIFYFYVRSLLQGNVKFRYLHLLHLAPAFAALALVVFGGIITLDLQSRSGNPNTTMLASILWYSSNGLSIMYAIWAMLALRTYVRDLKEQYSSMSIKEVTWLLVLSLCFLISWSWSIIVNISADLIGGVVADHVGTAHNFIRFLLMNGLILYSLTCSEKVVHVTRIPEERNDEAPSGEVIHKIENAIHEKKLHLQPGINIEQFSESIGVPSRTVSHTLNRHFGTRFFEYINQHRIEEAKNLLVAKPSASGGEMTILDILLASGFNNKSSFHRFFNRMVGMSPSEYRRQQRAALAGRK